MKEILQIGEKILKEKALEVKDILSPAIQKVISDMKKSLAKEGDGVAIAAPQIGHPYRIFVISDRVFDEKEANEERVYINPKIIKTSKRKEMMEEGCLSVRWKYGKVERAEKVTVEAYNEKGEKFLRGGSGLLAQIFQHEIDHLDGILFVEKAKDLTEYEPDEE